ncbi:hypothetical protein IH982_01200 [Patescibacteria group bacterium]|nr:hypothetical protein [Patescibacteria group bacterium]
MKRKTKKSTELTTKEDLGSDEGYLESEAVVKPPEKDSLLKRILSRLGMGALVVGGGALFSVITILQFLVTAIIGLGMIWWAVVLFLDGSIILGLLVLLIGTPIAIGLTHFFFFFFLAIGILATIIWGVANLFGVGLSFGNAWDIIWLVIEVVLLGGMAFLGVSGLIEAIKEKRVAEFFKGNWFYLLLFAFLFWLFFL